MIMIDICGTVYKSGSLKYLHFNIFLSVLDDGKISWEEFVAFFADGVMGKEELRSLFDEIDTHKTK